MIKNLKRATEYKVKHGLNCNLGAQMLLLPENVREVELLAQICRDTKSGLIIWLLNPILSTSLVKLVVTRISTTNLTFQWQAG